MSNKFAILIFIIFSSLSISAEEYNVYVDKEGVMRRDDTRSEVSYYGVNYTLPFAHAYRAIEYTGNNHKTAIDRDVYHFARLGFNAFRVHIWDVEISDGEGNLKDNIHLNLLDYLIAQCEKRGISIMLTAQTNFGNGYPERNVNTGAYSYLYDKCKVHDTESAIKAQERYAKSLAAHVNPYTGKTYAADNKIIIMEINNEPCHSGTDAQITAYVNRMVKAFRKGGWKKPLFYNVSHNMHATEAFYKADIQGTTFQWYPIGLVSGHQRKGNFLPQVDEYNISFNKVKNYNKMARAIYEYDPADILYSYIHPAMARTFRTAGFQWITQFAYDPIDLAKWNTEYQTHYLNLAYTPAKAISMKIAAEVSREVKRGESFGKYPQDTIFGSTTVSYNKDLSVFNNGEKFFYTNNTTATPAKITNLSAIAGVGSSPIIEYNGNGAYFIDKIDSNTWRLEVMPDVAIIADPFAKPSLSREVGKIFYNNQPISISLPSLGASYRFKAIDAGHNHVGKAENNSFEVYPGVYLLSADSANIDAHSSSDRFGVITLGEYVAPKADTASVVILHTPAPAISKGDDLKIEATVFGNPDSVMIYPDRVSFWSDNNKIYKMNPGKNNLYSANIDAVDLSAIYKYNVVSRSLNPSITYPQNAVGNPLDWDFNVENYYSTKVIGDDEPVVLLRSGNHDSRLEVSSVPEGAHVKYYISENSPMSDEAIHVEMAVATASSRLFIRKFVGDIVKSRKNINSKTQLCIKLADSQGLDSFDIRLITTEGITYSGKIKIVKGEARIGVAGLGKSNTALLPAPYPVFLGREFEPAATAAATFKLSEVENVEIATPAIESGTVSLDIVGVWLE